MCWYGKKGEMEKSDVFQMFGVFAATHRQSKKGGNCVSVFACCLSISLLWCTSLPGIRGADLPFRRADRAMNWNHRGRTEKQPRGFVFWMMGWRYLHIKEKRLCTPCKDIRIPRSLGPRLTMKFRHLILTDFTRLSHLEAFVGLSQ